MVISRLWGSRVHFWDHSHDCWQTSIPCHVNPLTGMLTVWHLALPSEPSEREETQDRNCSLFMTCLKCDIPLIALCTWWCRPNLVQCGREQHNGVNTRWRGSSWKLFCHTNLLSVLCVLISSLSSYHLSMITWWIEVHFNVDWSVFYI